MLDLDIGRHQGGWGRLRYVVHQLNQIKSGANDPEKLPKWDGENPLANKYWNDWVSFFKENGVFFSSPLDLDFSMIRAFSEAYGLDKTLMPAPDDTTCKSVLGKSHANLSWYSDDEKKYFEDYHRLFKVGSKPASHIEALSKLDLKEIALALPQPYRELVDCVKVKLVGVYE